VPGGAKKSTKSQPGGRVVGLVARAATKGHLAKSGVFAKLKFAKRSI